MSQKPSVAQSPQTVPWALTADKYKGKAWAELKSEQDKRIIGETWAEASDGTCLFAMPVANDFTAIDRIISGQ